MMSKIGITTQIIKDSKWYKRLDKLGFKTVEINRLNSKLYFEQYFLEKVKRYTRGYDLSIHSGTKGIFHSNRNFTNADMAVLRAELDICEIIGARELVFHLNNKLLIDENVNKLRDAIDYAKSINVRMLYESDSHLVAHDAYQSLEKFPDIGYAFDLGHFNNGRGKGILGCDVDEFVKNVRNHVEYVHASNNCGTMDEHNSLEDGTLDWRHVLDMLDLSRVVKIIIKVKHMDMVESSYRDLEQYMMSRFYDADNHYQRLFLDGGLENLNVRWSKIN